MDGPGVTEHDRWVWGPTAWDVGGGRDVRMGHVRTSDAEKDALISP